jgi:hypothetical protein
MLTVLGGLAKFERELSAPALRPQVKGVRTTTGWMPLGQADTTLHRT